jgi:hypothetical protein
VRIGDLNVKDTVDMECYVVFGDGDLRSNLDDLLPQIVHVRNLIDEGDHEVDTGLKLLLELGEAVDHSCIVLAHDNYESEV